MLWRGERKLIFCIDSAYSERYLGVPDNRNLYSYEDSNLLDNALLLKKKKFLIVFGTSDGKCTSVSFLHLFSLPDYNHPHHNLSVFQL